MSTHEPTARAGASALRDRNPSSQRRGVMGIRIGAAVAIAAAAGFGVWLVARNHNGNSATAAKPVAASVADLKALVTKVGHPVYWVGTVPGDTYELTQTSGGDIYIRYLTPGVAVGVPKPDYTTVGTYPRANAYTVLKSAASRTGETQYNTRSGALVATNSSKPTSVYFAFKNVPYLIEVFDPSAKRALHLVLSGQAKLVP